MFNCFIYVNQSDEITFQGINYRTSLEYYILNLRNTHTKATTLTTCPSPVITTCRLALTFKRPPACWQIRWDESIACRGYWYNVGATASALPTYSRYYYATAQLFETTTRIEPASTSTLLYRSDYKYTGREEGELFCSSASKLLMNPSLLIQNVWSYFYIIKSQHTIWQHKLLSRRSFQ